MVVLTVDHIPEADHEVPVVEDDTLDHAVDLRFITLMVNMTFLDTTSNHVFRVY